MLGVSSAALAVTAHVIGDGEVPDTAMTLLLTVLIGWNAAALAAKARGPMATIVDLGAGQVVMHLVLSSLSSHELIHDEPAPLSGGLAMTAAHVVATLVTALLLAKADGLLLGVLACLRALVPFILGALPVPAATASPVLARPAGPGHLVRVDLRRVHGRRGPPLFS
ncbi:hypothetical protein GCM10027598_05120 [Amycolatopsis oliviviridis]|uniref:Uncharacterized protein n=1 Tax=Amycolatopsis oliviviridis TaxID=1471590 RepID=A0ABQ3LLK2_9PSEU|nr:hypothetical protein [Amycolatopsis oliviviridis]GHH19645.1 hypothetical protein GCM10017790_38510 [Amycolatopsis oliviviridis]